MNIYEKLQDARIKFLNSGCKKSGENKFAKFKYFELADIIPILNPIMQELKMTTIISFDLEMAHLRLINSEKPEEFIIFQSPLADATVKGCTPIQSLGSQQTYIRRYLYLLAFDIIESDGLDSVIDDKKPQPETKQNQVSNLSILDKYKIEIEDITEPNQSAINLILEASKTNLDGVEQQKLIDFANNHWKSITAPTQ